MFKFKWATGHPAEISGEYYLAIFLKPVPGMTGGNPNTECRNPKQIQNSKASDI